MGFIKVASGCVPAVQPGARIQVESDDVAYALGHKGFSLVHQFGLACFRPTTMMMMEGEHLQGS